MNISKSLFLLGLILISAVSAQEDEGPHQNEANGRESEMRQLVISCILFTKHHLYNQQKKLQEVLDSQGRKQELQNILYKKVFSSALETCYQHMTTTESMKFLEDIQKKEFQLLPYEHVVETFDWNVFTKPGFDTTLTPMQESLFKSAEVNLFNIGIRENDER